MKVITSDKEYIHLMKTHADALTRHVEIMERDGAHKCSMEQRDALGEVFDAQEKLTDKERAMLKSAAHAYADLHSRHENLAKKYGRLLAICRANGLHSQTDHLDSSNNTPPKFKRGGSDKNRWN